MRRAILFLILILAPFLLNADSAITGIQGSDWDHTATYLYAAKGNEIYRSADGGSTYALWHTLPRTLDAGASDLFQKRTYCLMIPTRISGETVDRMLVSEHGSDNLYYCADISQADPTFTSVIHIANVSNGVMKGGVMSPVTEDSDGNLYLGWYSNGLGYYDAKVYKSTDRGASWSMIKNFSGQHMHNVKVNPYNDWIYAVVGELGSSYGWNDGYDIFRSKNGGSSWELIVDYSTGPKFLALEFVDDMVIMGQDQDLSENGYIYAFTDTGSGTFTPTTVYNGGSYALYLVASKMGDTVYFPSTIEPYTGGTTTARMMSSTDGTNWTSEQSLSVTNTGSAWVNAYTAVPTCHPDRGGKLVYSLSDASYYTIGTWTPTSTPPVYNLTGGGCTGCGTGGN